MKLTVIVLTYNHEPYIRQALDSVLAQQTDFDFEALVCEDYSTDATRQIVQEYAEAHPGKIHLLLSEKNNGAWVGFKRALEATQGEYLAFLDGDDYWTSPHKLQKQVDFMTSHPELTLSWHNFRMVDSEGCLLRGQQPVHPLKTRVDIKMMLQHPIDANPGAVMIRRSAVLQIPSWYWDCPTGDTPLWILSLRDGLGGYLDEVLGDYRVHSGGAMMGLNSIRRHDLFLQTCRHYLRNLDPEYRPIVHRRLARLWQGMVALQRQAGNYKESRKAAKDGLKDCPGDLRLWILAYAPWIWTPLCVCANLFPKPRGHRCKADA
jgi:glycosyltransferase involved in cell wall biosynthesis